MTGAGTESPAGSDCSAGAIPRSQCEEIGKGGMIEAATAWLVDHWHVAPKPLTAYLRESYGLEYHDAVAAMVAAKKIVEARR